MAAGNSTPADVSATATPASKTPIRAGGAKGCRVECGRDSQHARAGGLAGSDAIDGVFHHDAVGVAQAQLLGGDFKRLRIGFFPLDFDCSLWLLPCVCGRGSRKFIRTIGPTFLRYCPAQRSCRKGLRCLTFC